MHHTTRQTHWHITLPGRLTGAERRLFHLLPERDVVSVFVFLEEYPEEGVSVLRW